MPVASDNIAISIHEVTKKYRLFSSPRERLKEAFHPFRKRYHHEFWALKGVSFDVLKGQTVGIIGRNGSGKSTLLQIICSILQPTSGNVTVNGRVGSLLELGAGFNPEFTGRENVMLNGAIMGIPRGQMLERMPEIEAFADIGEFFDQPVKTYSSGMFVRLAFAAAINVDPDILVVDEALAVGDAKFQHKCFAKFRDFQEKGKTILFVSHDVNAILHHCHRAMLLHYGTLVRTGAPRDVVNRYIDLLEDRESAHPTGEITPSDGGKETEGEPNQTSNVKSVLEQFLAESPQIDQCTSRASYNEQEYYQRSDCVEILDYLVIAGERVDPTAVAADSPIDIYVKAKFSEAVAAPLFGLAVKTREGVLIYGWNSFFARQFLPPAEPGRTIIVKFSLRLNTHAGDIFLDLGVDESEGSCFHSLARRNSVIHLLIQEARRFDGLADLEVDFQEVSRQ